MIDVIGLIISINKINKLYVRNYPNQVAKKIKYSCKISSLMQIKKISKQILNRKVVFLDNNSITFHAQTYNFQIHHFIVTNGETINATL